MGLRRHSRQPAVILEPNTAQDAANKFQCASRRALWDDVATLDECALLRRAAMRAMQDELGAERLTVPAGLLRDDLFGPTALDLVSTLKERMVKRVNFQHGQKEDVHGVSEAGTIISWITPADIGESGPDLPLQGTYAPHVDKANRSSYDVSALLYLSTAGVDFHGGSFAFHDSDRDRLVQPKAGRMLTFCSGWHSLHSVRPVTQGHRLVLSVWFRRMLRRPL